MPLGWSSLPADLVNRVADCLLATNDLDCYTDLRAVCHHWRSVTADPSQHDPRFRPSPQPSESFSVDNNHGDCPASRLPLIAAAAKCAAANRESVPGAENIFDKFSSDVDDDCRCYAVAAAGEDMLAVLKWRRHGGVDVFKVDAAGNVVDRVKSIGSQALFLGVRCLVVDADYFPTVEPNCAYFQLTDQHLDQRYIYKFIIGRDYCHEEEPELVSAAMGNMRPSTLTQLLCNYTMDIPVPGHLLTWEKRYSELECEGYIDYVDDDSDDDYWYQPYSDFDQYVPDDDDYFPWY
ncbi:hypothetical protein BDA96_03G458000 [Sorghum bicolor]|uniref:KIB1-4 beta-propeller domain-containing protein n=1 Tax=Sorghum bicolor TaxID=4558 RepID=A0A921UTC4_SORBI|nr:hypothetical protein BDA96_03G458000 [Sorghum bicolor]